MGKKNQKVKFKSAILKMHAVYMIYFQKKQIWFKILKFRRRKIQIL